MQSQTLHAYKGKYKNEKNPHAISNFTQYKGQWVM